MRRVSNIDKNQPEIVDALRNVGAMVQTLASVGGGVPDLLVGYQGKLSLLEVKDPHKRKWASLLKPDQIKWHDDWRGFPVFVVFTADEAFDVIGVEFRK